MAALDHFFDIEVYCLLKVVKPQVFFEHLLGIFYETIISWDKHLELATLEEGFKDLEKAAEELKAILDVTGQGKETIKLELTNNGEFVFKKEIPKLYKFRFFKDLKFHRKVKAKMHEIILTEINICKNINAIVRGDRHFETSLKCFPELQSRMFV